MHVRTKVCGITRLEDLRNVLDAGADAIGLVFYPKSKRYVDLELAAELVAAVPAFVTVTGLFVDEIPENIQKILDVLPLDLLQFHGNESPAYCQQFKKPYIKAVRVQASMDLVQYATNFKGARGLLLDAFVDGVPGGTGHTFDWTLIPGQLSLPLILSGGLNPLNVTEAIQAVKPYAVDVSSGVEIHPGVKDAQKIQDFIKGVRNAELPAA